MKKRDDISTAALRRFTESKGGRIAAAKALDCSPQFVGQILAGQKRVPVAMLPKLGLELEIRPKQNS